VKYAFIDTERAHHAVAALCRVLRVSRSGFYAWRERVPSARDRANEPLVNEIRRVHREHRQICGALKT
jgi:putative transposase